MKHLLVILMLFIHWAAIAQTVNITSFQHVIRWVDEGRFPPYVTNEQVAGEILDAAALSVSNHFISTTVTRPAKLDYRNIKGFGKPSLKDPETDQSGNLQVSVLSFITRATTGMDVSWTVSVIAKKNGKTVYTREMKHELQSYKTETSWFTVDEFKYLFATLLDEVFENRTPLDSKITMGTKPADQDSLLRSNSERWTGKQNKGLFAYSKPVFGSYITLDISKIDSTGINKKSIAGRNTGVEISNGQSSFNQTKTVDQQKTNWYKLLLGNGTDTADATFAVSEFIRKEKKTVLGFLLSKSGTDDNSDYFYNRDIQGSISTGSASMPWHFSLNNYVNHKVGSGSLSNEQDTFSIVTRNATAFSTEIVLMNQQGNHLASVFFNMSDIDIYLQKNLSETYRQVIAALFAVIVSTKNQ